MFCEWLTAWLPQVMLTEIEQKVMWLLEECKGVSTSNNSSGLEQETEDLSLNLKNVKCKLEKVQRMLQDKYTEEQVNWNIKKLKESLLCCLTANNSYCICRKQTFPSCCTFIYVDFRFLEFSAFGNSGNWSSLNWKACSMQTTGGKDVYMWISCILIMTTGNSSLLEFWSLVCIYSGITVPWIPNIFTGPQVGEELACGDACVTITCLLTST